MNSIATTFSGTAAFIWSVADLLRGDFKQSQYGRIILPFTLLRRLECVLEPTKAAVLKQSKAVEDMPEEAARKLLLHSAAQPFYNTSHMDLGKLGQNQVLENLESYIHSFSPDAREIFDYFSFTDFLVQLNLPQVQQRALELGVRKGLIDEALSQPSVRDGDGVLCLLQIQL